MTAGELGEPSAVRRLQLDDVLATYVVDGVLLMNAAAFFPSIPSDYWAARPGLVTADGVLPMSASVSGAIRASGLPSLRAIRCMK